jgi:gliding motility-associated protein GldE
MYSLLLLLSEVHFLPFTTAVAVALALAVILLFASGFASGSEIAFFSLSPADISDIEDEKHPSDAKIKWLRSNTERTLATILITNNLVNVTIIMLCNYVFAHLVDFGTAVWLQFAVVTVILTFILLLFGEIMPKVYCGQHSLAVCRSFAPAITTLSKLFRPLSAVLMKSGVLAGKVVQKDSRVLSVDDLEQALELTDKEELKEEKNMLEGIVRFGDETAKEVMTSRQDIVDLDFKSAFPDVIRCVVENNYSRIPVYQGSIDNVRGILYIKDLLPHLAKPASFRWQSLIRPPYFVPETKKIDDLLRDFQANKVHIAIVVDEFGGTSGLITLEDILEEIVGEINDEYDEEEKSYVRVNANTYVFEGKTLLADFYRILNVDDDVFENVEGDADTLAGLMLELKGDFPKPHERIDYSNFKFEIVELDGHRISKIKVVVTKGSDATD